ncbi:MULTISPECIES: DUF2474 family protein [unclassified Acinetobacter]|jgi:hypothetical protein|nr:MULTISPECIES: DUF2474 family protein [unclassified Acinetobacter]OTG60244.1 DUF2474 domain-containing protein [Acinetobacter sp. ANC 4204]RGD90973.1 DUF2474 family protein [Acinetobacter sp. SWAC57]
MKKFVDRLSPQLWFILLWCFGVISLALIAGFFKLMLSFAY